MGIRGSSRRIKTEAQNQKMEATHFVRLLVNTPLSMSIFRDLLQSLTGNRPFFTGENPQKDSIWYACLVVVSH